MNRRRPQPRAVHALPGLQQQRHRRAVARARGDGEGRRPAAPNRVNGGAGLDERLRYGKVNVSTHTKWWGKGGAALASPHPDTGRSWHGIQSASTRPVPWVSRPAPHSLPPRHNPHTTPPQRGRLRVQKRQAARRGGRGKGLCGAESSSGLSVTTPSALRVKCLCVAPAKCRPLPACVPASCVPTHYRAGVCPARAPGCSSPSHLTHTCPHGSTAFRCTCFCVLSDPLAAPPQSMLLLL